MKRCPEGQVSYGGGVCVCPQGEVLKNKTGRCVPKPVRMQKFQCGFCHYSFERNPDDTYGIYDSDGELRTERVEKGRPIHEGLENGECPLHGDYGIIWLE